MTKFQKIAFFGFLFLIGALVFLEAIKPQPVNWFPSYTTKDKIPLGTYVAYNLLEEAFGTMLTATENPPYEVLKDSTLEGTYLFVNNSLPFDSEEMEQLLSWAAEGNSVFLSAKYHSAQLLDSLGLEIRSAWQLNAIGTQPMLNLINEKLRTKVPLHIARDVEVRYFKVIDTLSHTVLGIVQPYNETLEITRPEINFIKAPMGKGAFYLHTQPEVFSNYFLLTEDHAAYTENLLSYINNGKPVYWDNYYKAGKEIQTSPLYVLLNNRYLKWAYYFVLLSALLFIFFEGKRKQRSIPIIKPLENRTHQYTRTIAGLYLDKNENYEIALKQIALFFEFIRIRLRVPTEKIDARFMQTIAARSGNNMEDTKKLFTFIEKIQLQKHIEKEELLNFYKEITQYKKKLDGKS